MVFDRYAQYYDLIYRSKGYNKECNFLGELLIKHDVPKPKSILDIGCGTGSHMVCLLKKGYRVTGVDASKEMLAIAQKKIKSFADTGQVYHKKLQSFQLNKKFDVAICMFSVIDYILEDRDIRNTFKNVAKHMHSKSLFIFDFWHACAVNRYYSPKKRQLFKFRDKTFERYSKTKIFPSRKICEVHYTCTLNQKGKVLERFKEKHTLRYFSVSEIRDFLNRAGLKVLGIYPFLNINGKIRKNTWDITVVAKKT